MQIAGKLGALGKMINAENESKKSHDTVLEKLWEGRVRVLHDLSSFSKADFFKEIYIARDKKTREHLPSEVVLKKSTLHV